ncbi:MAG: ferredoxin family protein [Anaerolineales bacterium]|nr:ferredoxin family protein [Anaerolineales bacterium]
MSPQPTLRSSLLEHLQLSRNLRSLKIYFDPGRCTGAWECYEVCPVNCWMPDRGLHIVIFHDPEQCIACKACVLQCPEGAIELK